MLRCENPDANANVYLPSIRLCQRLVQYLYMDTYDTSRISSLLSLCVCFSRRCRDRPRRLFSRVERSDSPSEVGGRTPEKESNRLTASSSVNVTTGLRGG